MADISADLKMGLHAVRSEKESQVAQPEDVNRTLYAQQARAPWIRELCTHLLTYFSCFFSSVEVLNCVLSSSTYHGQTF